jgi:hypothetical protein
MAIDNTVGHGPRDCHDGIHSSGGEVDGVETLGLKDASVQVPDDFGFRRQPREAPYGPSSKVQMDDIKLPGAKAAPKPQGSNRIPHAAPPVKRICRHTCLLKQTDQRTRTLQKQGVNAVTLRIEAVGKGADYADHARSLRLRRAENVEYLLSHDDSIAMNLRSLIPSSPFRSWVGLGQWVGIADLIAIPIVSKRFHR